MRENLQSTEENVSEASIPFEALKFVYEIDNGTFWIDGRVGYAECMCPDGQEREAPLVFVRYSTLRMIGD
jgi:hypothetical protein